MTVIMSTATTAVVLLCLLIFETHSISEKDPRIIEGEISQNGQFPYVVGFHYTKSTGTNFCAGSIISKRLILTAAHCISGASNFTIYLGTNNLAQATSNGLVLTSTNSVVHPNYIESILQNDIGFIVLEKNLEYTDQIQPIQLATGTLGSGVNVIAVGWGATTDVGPSPSNLLSHVSVRTITNAQCIITYQNYVKDTMVCITGTGNQGTCRGDSGGPLVQTGSDGKDVHVALAIFHHAAGCETTNPSGYTRTFEYVGWIEDVTRDNPDISENDDPDNGGNDDPNINGNSSASTIALYLPLYLPLFFIMYVFSLIEYK